MPDLRQPPDWQQPADRHTPLIDPVITVRQLSRFGFARKSLTRIDHALVFSTSKGTYDAYLPPLRPSRGEAAGKRYTALYEVDMGVHPHHAAIALPSDNDAFEFTATVELSWQVVDPAAFVASGHRDVPTLLLGEVQQAARPLTRRFAIDDSASAEADLLRALTGPDRARLGETAGLKVIWTLRVRRDEREIEHERRLQSIEHTSSELIRTEKLGMRYDAELDRRVRQQDELQLGRAKEYERLDHQIAIQRTRQETALQQLAAEKIAFYRKYLEEGGVVAWAMHLAAHPEDSHLVINSMREDERSLAQTKAELARELLSTANTESYQLELPQQLAVATVTDLLNRQLSGAKDGTSSSPPLTTASASDVSLTKKDHDQASIAETPADKEEQTPARTFRGWQPPPGYGHSSAPPPAPEPTAPEQEHNDDERQPDA
ncbi:hypothetical protein ABZ930_12100 [Streptomyces sp. NPDC046716]|uniref:hypothetical protein n=1 Tax=Streptomyces sp. NPDC046716 TaxID=3157093 RepID=UPI0033FFD268